MIQMWKLSDKDCNEIDKLAIAECFSNMFGISTRFATGVLEAGKMVETINIYGLVVSMLHPSIARLLMIIGYR